MKALDAEMTSLLDKLYNLRGKDSIILLSMEKEKEEAVETKNRTSALKTELQSRINDLAYEESILADEGARLQMALSSINKDQFANVIERLNIDFDPDALRQKVDERLPETIEKVAVEKKSAGEELVKVEDEMNEAITKIEELGIRRDEAISNQERLNKYFELALDANINITRDEITSLLAKFDFTEEEQREAAKLLMFPEDGLFDYEKNYSHNRDVDRQVDEFAKELREKTSANESNDKLEEAKVEISEPLIHEEKEEPLNFEDIQIEVPHEDLPEQVQNEQANKETLMAFLKENAFDELDFTENDIQKMLENYNRETFENNIKLLSSYGIAKDIFHDNIELMYDKELGDKIQRLVGIGKTPQDMYLNPSVLIKYNLVELNDAIKVLTDSGLDPKNVPLMAY